MKTSISGRFALVAAFVSLAGVAGAQHVPTPIEWDSGSTEESWVSFSGGIVDVDGSAAAYQRLHQHEQAGFGGVDAFRFKTVDGDNTLLIQGKAYLGDGDMDLLIRKESGSGSYIQGGFKINRTFYEGIGGFVPTTGAFYRVFDDQLMVDRTEFWLEAALVRDSFTGKLRYSHQGRDGEKDSTMWGDAPVNRIGVVPSLLVLDETRETVTLDLTYENEATTAGGGLRYQSTEIDNKRYLSRQPGRLLGPGVTAGNQGRDVTTRDISSSDLFSGHVHGEHRVGEKIILTGAASTTKLDMNLSGARIFGDRFDAPYDINFPRGSTDHGYIGLHGDAEWRQYVIVANGLFMPAKNLRINAGVRFEKQEQETMADFLETAGNRFEEEFVGEGTRDFQEALESVEVTYTGLENIVLGAFGELAQGSGDLFEEGGTSEVDRDTRFDRDYSKVGFSARFYPAGMFNLSAGGYRKVRDNDYRSVEGGNIGEGEGDTSPTNYPAFITSQKLTTDDLYVRATVRPFAGLSIVGRYDWQRTDIDSGQQGINVSRSARLSADIVSLSATYAPLASLVLQASLSYTDDKVVTGVIGSSTAAVATGVGQFESDYMSGSFMAIWAVSEAFDLQADYTIFDADNHDTTHAASVLPYGLTATNESIGVTLTHRLSENLRWSVRLAHGKYDDATSGGYSDFTSDMVYGRIQLRF